MKLFIGIFISFAVGVGCRYFDIPVPSPPVIPGALLVLAMTIGYSTTNSILNGRGKPATTAHMCGGPTGRQAEQSELLSAGVENATESNSVQGQIQSRGLKR
jgi:XapX domain-containing protein